jgi:hypothetical protein
VQFTKILGAILGGLNTLIDRVPALGTALSAVIAVGGIAKALQLAAALTGVNRLICLLRVAKVEAATTTAVAGGGAAVRGRRLRRGARGRGGRVAQRASSALAHRTARSLSASCGFNRGTRGLGGRRRTRKRSARANRAAQAIRCRTRARSARSGSRSTTSTAATTSARTSSTTFDPAA